MIKRFLTTHQHSGSFDFYSNIIEIQKYDSKYKKELELVLESSPESLSSSWQSNALALYFHEVVHFLDMTTTTWGLEYIFRKHLILETRNDSKPAIKPLEVFMLNTSEIQMHSELVSFCENKKLLDCSLKHGLRYSQKYGTFIEVYFFNGENRIATVPLSMLSVLEAHAYACEILCQIRYIESRFSDDREVSLRLLESEVNSYLNNKEFLEYSLLIILCKAHFDFLTLKEVLLFLEALISRVLNMQTINLSAISSFLANTFQNAHYGRAICKDLQRGMSRPVVVFKLILFVYQLVNTSPEKDFLIGLIKESPEKVFDFVIEYYGIKFGGEIDLGDDNEFSIALKGVLSKEDAFDRSILLESSEVNRETLKRKNWSEISLSDFKLLNSLLSDGTVIDFPNRISLDVMHYFEESLDVLLNIERLFKGADVSKFHIHPDDVVMV